MLQKKNKNKTKKKKKKKKKTKKKNKKKTDIWPKESSPFRILAAILDAILFHTDIRPMEVQVFHHMIHW